MWFSVFPGSSRGCGGRSNLVKISEQLGKSGTQPTLLDNMVACFDDEFFVTALSMNTPYW
jgi:hypothetical protein